MFACRFFVSLAKLVGNFPHGLLRCLNKWNEKNTHTHKHICNLNFSIFIIDSHEMRFTISLLFLFNSRQSAITATMTLATDERRSNFKASKLREKETAKTYFIDHRSVDARLWANKTMWAYKRSRPINFHFDQILLCMHVQLLCKLWIHYTSRSFLYKKKNSSSNNKQCKQKKESHIDRQWKV